MMTEPKFAVMRTDYNGAIYSGKCRFTPYSVTVRYKQREVSISAGGTRQKDIAQALLAELIEADLGCKVVA